MILFVISFFLIFASSYLLTSTIAPKRSVLGIIYLFLIAFAQIVLTFEILSLFTAIKEIWVLLANIIFTFASIYIWNKKGKQLWGFELQDIKDFRTRINNSFRLDKSLMWLYVGFCVFIISALILCAIMPITSADANGYHVNRSLFWVLQGSLNHFDIPDVRNLCLPINSEILYSWVLLFVRNDVFLGFFSFVGYLLSIISVYNILGYLGFCTRKKLWTIFILSSLPSVLVQASGTETDIIIAGLVTSSIFLFWYALKHDKKTPIFMSSLAYALAIGTKTTALIAAPSVGIGLIALCVLFKKYKPFTLFLGFGLLNFLIFSSFNYILNFIQFHNFMGSESFMLVSKNYYGIKAIAANFIKYIFMFFDFTGFKWAYYLGPHILSLREFVLSSMHLSYIQDGLYTTGTNNPNATLIEPMMGAGILGFLIFIPCLIWSFIKPIFKRNTKKTWFMLGFASLFILNILIISYTLAYMAYSVRFVMFFMVLSSPVLTYSYFNRKNPIKYVVVFFALFYLICVSTHLWARPVDKILKMITLKYSITDIRFRANCKDFYKDSSYGNSACLLKFYIKNNYSTQNRILAFLPAPDDFYIVKELEFNGYKIDFKTLEEAHKIDFNKYNLIISTNNGQASTFIKEYPARKNECKIIGQKIIITDDNLIPCIYASNDKIPKQNPASKQPYQVRCGFTSKFIKNNKFNKIASVGIFNPLSETQNFYVIYHNTHLPIIKLSNQIKK